MTSIDKYCVLEKSSCHKRKGTYMTMLYPSRCPHPHTTLVSPSPPTRCPSTLIFLSEQLLGAPPRKRRPWPAARFRPSARTASHTRGKEPSFNSLFFPQAKQPKAGLLFKERLSGGWTGVPAGTDLPKLPLLLSLERGGHFKISFSFSLPHLSAVSMYITTQFRSLSVLIWGLCV